MALIDDRDLLILEPALFTLISSLGTVFVAGSDGIIAGTTLTTAASDFAVHSIDLGNVIVVDGEALEVVTRISPTSLTVSRPRASSSDPAIAPDAGILKNYFVQTYQRSIELLQSWIFGALGIDEDDPVQPLDEDSIVNSDDMQQLISVRTAHHLFARAAAANPADMALRQMAEQYTELARGVSDRTRIMLDLDGDGLPDATRAFAAPVTLRV